MMLLVDAGNSFLKWCTASVDRPCEGLNYCRSASADLEKVLTAAWRGLPRPERIIVASVAGRKTSDVINNVVGELWQAEPEYLASSRSFCGLENSYTRPEQLGIDRLLAMLAAYRMTGGPVIIIDCGTAVTVDLVNEDGSFLGGVIMPGVRLACQSLATGTGEIRGVAGDETVNSIARSTSDAVTAGVLLGLAGGVEKVVADQRARLGSAAELVITGGDAKKLIDKLDLEVVFKPDLVLEGLYLYATGCSK